MDCRWVSCSVGVLAVIGLGQLSAQERDVLSEQVSVDEVLAWLETPPRISNLLGLRVDAVDGVIPEVSGEPIRSKEGSVDLHHLRWDEGKFFSRLLLSSSDFGDPFAIPRVACGGIYPNYWAITGGADSAHLTCVESEDPIDTQYDGSWIQKSAAAVLVVAAQKKIQEFLNLGLLRIRSGSIDLDRVTGQFTAVSTDGTALSGLFEIRDDSVLEAVQYWHRDEPLPQIKLGGTGELSAPPVSYHAFRVAFTYGEHSRQWRIPSRFEVSHLLSVVGADSVDSSLSDGTYRAHGNPFLRYQILRFEKSETDLPSHAFTHQQISEGEPSPIDMRHTIYSNSDGHFRKSSAGSLIPLRTVTSENATRWPARGAKLSRFLYLGILVILGGLSFWWFRAQTEKP